MQKIDSNKLENDLVKYFEYMEYLNKNIRLLKRKIKYSKEALNSELSDEKEYINIITSLNMGKGKYSKISILPYDMKAFINSKEFNNMSQQDQEEYKTNYKYAIMQSEQLDERLKTLEEDRRERLIRIKEFRNDLNNYKRNLTLNENEYKKNLLKAKKLDKQVQQYMKHKTEKPKQYINKPSKKEDK